MEEGGGQVWKREEGRSGRGRRAGLEEGGEQDWKREEGRSGRGYLSNSRTLGGQEGKQEGISGTWSCMGVAE
ncbi:hypothetical protein Pmani_021686 [Petrolisthes manimaculis]|uniref:Uncharacterized protein n=1 Tax=Petrolisthes manimaculis TaxID=1843537 RepID=A0AAE1PDK6_9EUCA|nr:hypothetical protein Pmani_021686 [Petrolisthes manimaculis]